MYWKKGISLILPMLILAVLFTSIFTCVVFHDEPDEAVEIYDWHDLYDVRNDLSGHYVMMKSLGPEDEGYMDYNDPGGDGWLPIGNNTSRFTGTFDGSSCAIEGLYIDRPSETGVGLFGVIDSGAYVRMLELVDTRSRGFEYTGSLAGSNLGTIEHSHSMDCEVEGTDYLRPVGVLVGYNGGIIHNSSVSGNITGISHVGGLVGYNGGTISNSYSSVKVVATDVYSGGLVGKQLSGGTIYGSHSHGEVYGHDYTGGLVGMDAGTTSNSYSTIDVDGADHVGGLIGHKIGAVTRSYSVGSVTGTGTLGGLIGKSYDVIVTDSFWDIESSGIADSDGGIGKTTAEMMDLNTFTDANWQITSVDSGMYDLDHIWNIVDTETYPFLSWERIHVHVIETVPAPGSEQVEIDQDVMVMYSESANTSVTPTLTQTRGDPVTYYFSHWQSTFQLNDTAVWTHDNWSVDEIITVEVSGFKSEDGYGASSYIWSFSTYDAMPPDISDLSDTPKTGISFTFKAEITHALYPNQARVFYYTDVTPEPTNATMVYQGDSIFTYTYDIPSNAKALYYNISAESSGGFWNETGTLHRDVVDVIPPSIVDNTPTVGTTGSIFTFSARVTDNIELYQVNVEYSFDDGTPTNISMTNVYDETFQRSIDVPVYVKVLYYHISARDSRGNWGRTQELTIPIDDVHPPIVIDNSPLDIYTGDVHTWNATVIDAALEYVRVRFSINEETPVNISLRMRYGTDFFVRSHTIPLDAVSLSYEIIAKDMAGNFASTGFTTLPVIDNKPPESNCISPSYYNSFNIPVKYTAYDNVGVSNVSLFYQWEGTGWHYYGKKTNSQGEFNFVADREGTWEFHTIANDTSGNTEPYMGSHAQTTVDLGLELEVSIISPVDGHVTNNLRVEFHWYSPDERLLERYEFKMGTEPWLNLGRSTSTSVTLAEGPNLIRVRAYGCAWGYVEDSITVTTDTSTPLIINNSPTGVSVAPDAEISVTWSKTMDTTITPNLTLMNSDYSHGFSFSGWSSVYRTNDTATWTPLGNYPSDAKIDVRVYGGKDLVGNTAVFLMWFFVVENFEPPGVLNTIPSHGAIDVEYMEKVKVVFNERMLTDHLPTLTVVKGTTPPDGFIFDGWSSTYTEFDTAVWRHRGFAFEENIKLRVSDHKDSSGNRGLSYRWNITTEEDYIPPQVLITAPEAGQEKVSYFKGEIKVVFHETLNTTDELQLSIIHELEVYNAEFVRFETTFNINDTVIFRYNNLPSDEWFNVTVFGYEDMHGNVGDRYTWSFNTVPAHDDTVFTNRSIIFLSGIVTAVAVFVYLHTKKDG